jgi:hypothetical protein
MFPTWLAAALIVIAGASSNRARPPSALEQPSAQSARAAGAPDMNDTKRPSSPVVSYRLNEGRVSNGHDWSPDIDPSWLSQSLVRYEPREGVTLRLHSKKLYDKFDVVGGGSGVGPSQYAGRKRLMLSILKSF